MNAADQSSVGAVNTTTRSDRTVPWVIDRQLLKHTGQFQRMLLWEKSLSKWINHWGQVTGNPDYQIVADLFRWKNMEKTSIR